ncbi:MAG: hypothetical protein WDO71_12615 [Bacteroidota bacterium]
MRAIYLLLLTGIGSMMANAQNNTAYSSAPVKTTKEANLTVSGVFHPHSIFNLSYRIIITP